MAYTFAQRQAAARAAGFSGYAEQRRMRHTAQQVYPTPNTKGGIELRDRTAKLIRDYTPGDMTRSQIQKALGLRQRRKPTKQTIKLLRHLSPKRARER